MRKEWKKHARSRLKKHYAFYLLLCLLLGMLGISYYGSLSTIKNNMFGDTEHRASTVYEALASKTEQQLKETEKEQLAQEQEQRETLGIISLEHARGVAAQLVNSVSTGQILTSFYHTIYGVIGAKSISLAVFIILSLLVVIIFREIILNVITVTFKRVMMEGRVYDKVPMKRFLYLIRINRWWNVAKTMFLTDVFSILWFFTIIGGFIKAYSYMMVPYIMAENPEVQPLKAITLSRNMMKGHKWEAFKLQMSFLGWNLLDQLTWGFSGIFYSNPYMEATMMEYYAFVRQQAIVNGVEGAELLDDIFLYEKADEETLNKAYADVNGLLVLGREPEKRGGFLGILENIFGITFFYDEKEKAYEEYKGKEYRIRNIRAVLDGEMYPTRLFKVHDADRVRKMSTLHYDRHYSAVSLVLMFFTMCFIGWLWEGTYCFMSSHVFPNRGVLHGPWLPIYGTGGLLILLILNKLRSKPVTLFFSAIFLCGILEYTSGWYLEITHDGQKWWDYSGYFLNIHGRVCAEGLLVFGLGGVAIVYVLAPFMDNMFRRLPLRGAAIVCALLLVIYFGDNIYSAKHPNMGAGVTDIGAETPDTEENEAIEGTENVEETMTVYTGELFVC